MSCGTSILTLALVLLPAQAMAQEAASLPAGTRVRIERPDTLRFAPLVRRSRFVIGSVVRATPDTMYLELGVPGTLAISRSAMRSLAVSRGASRARSAVQQALFAGLVLGALAYSPPHDGRDRSLNDAAAWAAGGVVLGAAVGYASPYEQWRRLRR